MPIVTTASGNSVPHPGLAASGQPACLGAGMLVGRLGNHDHHLVIADRGDRARHPGREEVVDRGGNPVPERRGRPGRPRWPGGLESDRQDPVLAGGVVAEVPGPPCHLAVVAPAADQQPLDRSSLTCRAAAATIRSRPRITPQIVAACSVTSRLMSSPWPIAAERHQVRGDVVADQDRRDDDPTCGAPGPRRSPDVADVGQPQRPAGLRGVAEHGGQPGAGQVRADVVGHVFASVGRGSGEDVEPAAHHSHGRRGPLGQQPGHRGHVGVLQRQPGEVLVDRDQLAQQRVLVLHRAVVYDHRLAGIRPRVRHTSLAYIVTLARSCGRTQRTSPQPVVSPRSGHRFAAQQGIAARMPVPAVVGLHSAGSPERAASGRRH